MYAVSINVNETTTKTFANPTLVNFVGLIPANVLMKVEVLKPGTSIYAPHLETRSVDQGIFLPSGTYRFQPTGDSASVGVPAYAVDENGNIIGMTDILNRRVGAFKQMIASKRTPITRVSDGVTDTTIIVMDSYIIPGGIMGLNSKISIVADWDIPNNTDVKNLYLDIGTSNVSWYPYNSASVHGAKFLTEFFNTGSLTKQKCLNTVSYSSTGTKSIDLSYDTTNPIKVSFKTKWNANVVAGQAITLLGYSIWLEGGD